MKNILIGVAALVVLGGVSFALVSQNMLTGFFEVGDIPTEEQFSDTIDSALNLQDDGITTETKTTGVKEDGSASQTGGAGAVSTSPLPAQKATVLSEKQKEFKLDVAEDITFTWTPVTPKPDGDVTYRLKVWQLMQGQNATQAMAKNAPLVTKDVTNNSEITVSGLYTGPCKPPYLCDFVWDVEILSAATLETGTGADGTSTSGSADGTR